MASAVTFSTTSPITGVANAISGVITLAAGETRSYVYLPTSTSNNRGARFYVTHDGTNTDATQLTPLIVKWDDRAAVQGYCNPQWAIPVHGPIDIVIDISDDVGCTITEFS